MRKIAFAMAILFLAGLALPLAGEGKTHEVTVQVVSTDVATMMMTVKGDDGKDKTVPVSKTALEQLKKVKAGDEVVVTCQDNDKGEHQAIVAIKPVKS